MTPRQAQLYHFIEQYTRENDGVCPSFDEMSAAVRINKSGIHRHLTALEHRGLIARSHHMRRSIRIVGGPPTVDALRAMVGRLVKEEGPTIAVSALISLAQEIAPQIGSA